MPELVFLAHRIPYPPDKGDKIRSWNFLNHLAQRYDIRLGCFIDDPRDWEFTDTLRQLCRDCCFVGITPRLARLGSLRGLLDGRALTLPYYDNQELRRWTRDALARPEVTHAVVYCSAMAQYIEPDHQKRLRCVADIVDIDSAKWAEYAQRASLPWRWLYQREARTLQQIEGQIAVNFDATIVATDAELELLQKFAPEGGERLATVRNGVDSDYFSPERAYDNPYAPGDLPLVFVGAMDYWPNADAVVSFVNTTLPAVRERLPAARFFIVGSNPPPDVTALASSPHVVVTGRVPDVRPYVAHAAAIVAPLRVARGVQNKVLEGMAMGKPVIGSLEALTGITAEIGKDVLRADTVAEFTDTIFKAVMTEQGKMVGRHARARMMTDYGWDTSLRQLDRMVDGPPLMQREKARSGAAPLRAGRPD
jgi:sugar transferase (PEP-CTERM/EpsH1 system associated)